MTKQILFLVPYPLNEAPSQRFRFEQYFQYLEGEGFQFLVQSFLPENNWKLFFEPGHPLLKAVLLATGFLKRLIVLLKAPGFDFIFIHREVTPLGPPVFEWILSKILRKRIVYDFDDAIWMTDRIHESPILRTLKWRSKVESICRWSFKVTCGNEYLCAYARKYNKQVFLNPTTIDTQHWHNPELFPKTQKHSNKKIVIGWTGSHSTLKYLKDIEPVLQTIESEFPDIQIQVIADQDPKLKLNSFLFLNWREETEIEDLLKFDIGIMPLPDHEWAKGKCGFKLLQYMALRIPAVASPVGVNPSIITDGENGLLCNTLEQWKNGLVKLSQDDTLRKKMGENGRIKIIECYSVESNVSSFLSLFE